MDLTGLNLADVTLTGSFAADNQATLSVNGTAVASTVYEYGFTQLTPFSVSSGLVAGVNTLTFAVTNLHENSPAGLLVTGVAVSLASNSAPDAADDTAATDEDTPATVSVLANDDDPDDDDLVVTAGGGAGHGTVAVNAGGTVTYTPDANWHGTDTFTYTIADGFGGTDTGTVTVTVASAEDAPVAADDTATGHAAPVTVAVLDNDTDGDGDPLTIQSFTQPLSGAVTQSGGQLLFTFDHGWTGTAEFDYVVTDGNGGSATATVTLTVDPVNDDPVAVDDSATTDEDTAVSIDVLANDSDPDGDSLTVTVTSGPVYGTLVEFGNGSFLYVPDTNWNGIDGFTYSVDDGSGGTAEASVTITVDPVNDPPVAADDAGTLDGGTVSVNVLSNDYDVDGDDLSVTVTQQTSSGTLYYLGYGQFVYAPAATFAGTDTFVYEISDGHGGTDSATVTLTIPPRVWVSEAQDAKEGGADGWFRLARTGDTAQSLTVTIDVVVHTGDAAEGDDYTTRNASAF